MTWLTDQLQALCNGAYALIPRDKPSPEKFKQTNIVAHRGAWKETGEKENTLPAFKACLDHDIWAIEFDIRWSTDNVPFVHHDSSTKRVFQRNIIIEKTKANELRQLLPEIPSLEEVLQTFQSSLHFMIELKNTLTTEQERVFGDLLKNLEPCQDYHLMSLEPDTLSRLTHFPKACLVTIARTDIRSICQETLKSQYGALTGQYFLLSNKMEEQCHQNNIKVGTGFPDSKNCFYREVERGVDWVFTNHPIKLANLT